MPTPIRHLLSFVKPAIAEPIIRGGALFLGGYFLWSWLMYFTAGQPYDATIWWVDLRWLPGLLGGLLSMAFGVALLHRAVWPTVSERVGRPRRVVLCGFVAVLVFNTLLAWRAGMSHVVLGIPIPLTAVLAVAVLPMLRRPTVVQTASWKARLRCSLGIVSAAACWSLLAALSQMFWFGESDYRRPADAILVYGCKAHADGTPSQALADRVHTACELYHQGLAPILVMSGGPVRHSELNETQVMADYAVSLGVPREAILLDPNGLDTQSTANNLDAVVEDVLPTASLRVLAVSHDYHLPRVKLSLEREGLTAYTVPAEIRRGLPSKPYLIARETAAWWYYFFRPVIAALSAS